MSVLFSVLGARILVITAIVLSAIGAIQVWLACKCCILIDENVKPCLLLATGTIQISILILNTGPLPRRVVTDGTVQAERLTQKFFKDSQGLQR